MEIDVDDVLEYPEDDFIPHDNFDNEGDNARRTNSSPPSKRRNAPSREFVSKIVSLDQSMLDSSLDWYMRMDLNSEKASVETHVREKQMDENIRWIRSARNLRQSDGSGANLDDGSNSEKSRGRILNYPPRGNTNWLPITTPSEKNRLYVTMKPPDRGRIREGSWSTIQNSGQGLLGRSFGELMEMAEKIIESKATSVEETAAADTQMADSGTVYFTERMNTEAIGIDDDANTGHVRESNLWVDKYKPKGYIDLLSDDGVNRTLLTWLKLWDECVFGRKASNRNASTFKKNFTGPAVFKDRLFAKGILRNKGSNKSPSVADADQLPTTLDSFKRPVHKITLLFGPPGVGKTTLAHVVAGHAGYHVQEMNASDDRTLEAFRKQLEGATQMQATLDGDRRPHCLVIDEIDGAPTPSINYLVSLANGSDERGNADRSIDKLPGGKQGSKLFVVRRPIICICNDLYAPALRELRKVALVVQVPAIELNRLSERLHQIAQKESVSAEPGSLELMSSKSGYDVRSCINSLQLLTFSDKAASREDDQKRLTLSHVMSADVGGKDIQRSLFSTWQEIFQLPKTQKRTLHNEASGSSLASRVQNVMTACGQCSEEDRLLAGVYENYLTVDFRDPRLESVSRGLEWLGFVDRIDRLVGETQMFELKRYSCYVSAMFHLLFASRQFVKLTYPQMTTEVSFRIAKSLATLQSLLVDVKCSIRAFLDCTVLTLDVLPLLLRIVQPTLRPVNVQLYSEQEKSQLQRVVAVMRDYNMTYRQQRSVHGHYDFVLEPPVEEIVHISSSAATDQMKGIVPTYKSHLSNTVKQVITREIELAKVRTNEPKQAHGKDQSVVENKRGATRSMETDERNAQSTAFKNRIFGLNHNKSSVKVGGSNSGDSAIPNTDVADGGRVWYRYHEGCNDAIRRYFRLSELL